MPGYADMINRGLGYMGSVATTPYSAPMAAYQQAKNVFGLGSQMQDYQNQIQQNNAAYNQFAQNMPAGYANAPQQQGQGGGQPNYSGQGNYNRIQTATGYSM